MNATLYYVNIVPILKVLVVSRVRDRARVM
jgi:hypothetical protein